MLAPRRRAFARDHGAELVRGWVALYTLGLPGVMRIRRRSEVDADLAEEALDAIRHATIEGLARRRLIRLLRGLPADLAWRFLDAPAMAATIRIDTPWVPPTRWTLIGLGGAAIGTAGAFALVVGPLLDTTVRSSGWLGWGPYGFAAACVVLLVAIVLAVPSPARALAIAAPAAMLGTIAAPWFVGPWALVVVAVGARWYESHVGARP